MASVGITLANLGDSATAIELLCDADREYRQRGWEQLSDARNCASYLAALREEVEADAEGQHAEGPQKDGSSEL